MGDDPVPRGRPNRVDVPDPAEIVDTVLDEAVDERRRTSPPEPDELDLWPCLAAALLEPGVGPALAARAAG